MTKSKGGGPNRRNVTPSGEGGWAVNGGNKVAPIFPTQKAAIERAHKELERTGGGELTTHGRDGKIRDSDTVAPGNDPSPPKDRK